MHLKHLLPDLIHFHGHDSSGYAHLSWIAPWNSFWDRPDAPWVFHLDFDWDPRYDPDPTHGCCHAQIFGFFWCLIQGSIEAAKGLPVTPQILYLPPQLEGLDRRTSGRFRQFLFSEWKKGAQAEWAAHYVRTSSAPLDFEDDPRN